MCLDTGGLQFMCPVQLSLLLMGLRYVKLVEFVPKGMSESPWHHFTLADGRQCPRRNIKQGDQM